MPSGSPKAPHPPIPAFLKDGEEAATILGYGVPAPGILKIFISLDDHSYWYEVAENDVLHHDALSSDPLSPTVFFVKPAAPVTYRRIATVAVHRQFAGAVPGDVEQEIPGAGDIPRVPLFTYITTRCLTSGPRDP